MPHSAGNIQNYSRLYDYIHEYQALLYDYYSKHAIAFLTTYYNLDCDETVWDDVDIMGGSYENVGELSGVRWNKYLLLPVFWIEEVSTSFEATELGYVKEGATTFVIPSSYGIQPYPRDFIKFEQSFLRPTNDIYPLFRIEGIEKSANTDLTFWKLKANVWQSMTEDNITNNNHINNTYTFFEFTKQIYEVDDATMLTRLLIKEDQLKENLERLFNHNSGFYLL